jgi:hypothetical protein
MERAVYGSFEVRKRASRGAMVLWGEEDGASVTEGEFGPCGF